RLRAASRHGDREVMAAEEIGDTLGAMLIVVNDQNIERWRRFFVLAGRPILTIDHWLPSKPKNVTYSNPLRNCKLQKSRTVIIAELSLREPYPMRALLSWIKGIM